MTTVATCPQGHQWEVERGDEAASQGGMCPICGAAAEGQSPSLAPRANTSDETAVGEPLADLTQIPPFSLSSLPPRKIGGYEVQGVLGRGGMGVVYKVIQPNLKRVVALKMIVDPDADIQTLARFRTEAEAVARLQHPNIIEIHEIGED